MTYNLVCDFLKPIQFFFSRQTRLTCPNYIDVFKCLQVTVEVTPTEVNPGEDVFITVHADANSKIYLLGEDQRNRILGTENDIFSSVVSRSH